MLFAIDIDRTIAGGFKAYIEHHNQDLEPGILPHVLGDLTDYRSFLYLPDVIMYRRKNETRLLRIEGELSCIYEGDTFS